MKTLLLRLHLLLLGSVLLSACGSMPFMDGAKQVPYLQNSDSYVSSDENNVYDLYIMPKDLLMISVFSPYDNEAVSMFNLRDEVALNGTTRTRASASGEIHYYIVDNEGCIEFPVVGSIHVGGLSKENAEQLIHDKIAPFLQRDVNFNVTCRIQNYNITVLGEVRYPTMFYVDNGKVSIFEALARAGDLTIDGQRKNIKLIRVSETGGQEIHTLDLTDANILNSPYYYLRQRDIIYVEPNKSRKEESAVGTSTRLWFRGVAITVSLGSLLYRVLN
jgi:polysaccharide export outer membrane protein